LRDLELRSLEPEWPGWDSDVRARLMTVLDLAIKRDLRNLVHNLVILLAVDLSLPAEQVRRMLPLCVGHNMAEGLVLSHPNLDDPLVRDELLRGTSRGAASYLILRRGAMSPETASALLGVLSAGNHHDVAALFRRPDFGPDVVSSWLAERPTRSRAILDVIAARPELRGDKGIRAHLVRAAAIGEVAWRLAEDARPEEFAALFPLVARSADLAVLSEYVERVQASGGRLAPEQLARFLALPGAQKVFAVLHRLEPAATAASHAPSEAPSRRGRARR
jgi:hypothetical protein